MTWFFFIAPILGFVIIMRLIDYQAKQDRDKLKVMEQALKNESLDPETRERLMEQISGKRMRRRHGGPHPETENPSQARSAPGQAGNNTGLFSRLFLFVGWCSLFMGLAMFGVTTVWWDDDAIVAGIIMSCAGVCFITYPFALADLEYRRARATQAAHNADRKARG